MREAAWVVFAWWRWIATVEISEQDVGEPLQSANGGDVAGYTDYPFYDAMAPA
jgi:hypothetical protein